MTVFLLNASSSHLSDGAPPSLSATDRARSWYKQIDTSEKRPYVIKENESSGGKILYSDNTVTHRKCIGCDLRNYGLTPKATKLVCSSVLGVIKAIVQYSATVPYKFPTHVTSRLLQLQASLGI
ncbi:hypothetical protein GCK72_001082 [Caenorhabditis remanei]|uniref:Uncharacterized protein n=1 Tax=Caenorhabditis remanei TaxID=31234 RepID=A0A6A5HRF3_CAERE|nr:hypothetical protein GCK72_001082 [Caenorhabditis remanei]KAF1769266.1 hypothetical protein GCK72_001082 [Caenorhabditis remanei]